VDALSGTLAPNFSNLHGFLVSNRCKLAGWIGSVADVRTPAELTEAFRRRGLKITPQRQRIFRILHENTAHPTAESVYAVAAGEMPSISLRTVYQTLNDLAEMGEIHALDLGTGSARFDPNLSEHHHLVCDRCGMVRDVELDTSGVHLSAEALDGFAVRTVDVVFRGRCAACQPTS
jgi:Fe2+ or Zn2+ uptake regulation protein